jgi:hypothetical protein
MSHALERAEHYRDLAKRYLRLAASTETPNHYLRIAVQYNALAEADELSTQAHVNGDLDLWREYRAQRSIDKRGGNDAHYDSCNRRNLND